MKQGKVLFFASKSPPYVAQLRTEISQHMTYLSAEAAEHREANMLVYDMHHYRIYN